MEMIERAERAGRARALALYVFAGMSIALLALSLGPWKTDFFEGMWLSVTGLATLYLAPIEAVLKDSPLARLLNDETTREHRRISSVVGLWAGLAAAAAMLGLGEIPGLVTPSDAARIIFTAAVAATMVYFATLELQAAR